MNEEQKHNLTKKKDSNDLLVYATTTLQPLVHLLESQIQGAAQASDIEYVHKMRVTSRRIRAAISVYKQCLPKNQQTRWREEIRSITQSLGTARDLDVQINFLEQYMATLTKQKEKCGIEYLITVYREHRAMLQPDVVKHLQQLKASGVLEELHDFCVQIQSDNPIRTIQSFPTYQTAQKQIKSRLNEFLSLENYVQQEDATKKHHEMRIAAKRLRYTMELFNDLYGKNLDPYISVMKQFQDHLGEIHDCDVWCASIPMRLDDLKKSPIKEQITPLNKLTEIEEGLASFLLFVRSRRKKLYTEFLALWDEQTRNSTFQSLRTLLRFSAVLPSNYQKKIAILADIHGNLDALEKVLEDAQKNDVKLIINVGDLVGYGPYPQEVISHLQSKNILNILGNFDEEVLEWNKDASAQPSDEKDITLQYTVENLEKPSIQFLKSLPKQTTLKIGNKSIFFTHGSPSSIDEHVYPNTPEERLQQIIQEAKTDVVVLGHSHMPFIKSVGDKLVVNPGSVGRPGDGDPCASYAVLTVEPFAIELKKVPYDILRAVDTIRQRHLPERFAKMLLQGSSLDSLLQEEIKKISREHLSFGRSILTSRRNEKKKKNVLKVAERYIPDITHANQVTKTALSLFDQLISLHPLGPDDRFWLECAGILHDIGLSHGIKGHHKTTFRLIVIDPFLSLNARERQMVGIIARYHRKKLPSMHQEPFRNLPILDRSRVQFLAAILRVADALDASHSSIVKNVNVKISETSVILQCLVNGNTQLEEEMINKKKDLFEKIFNRSLLIIMQDTLVPKEKLSVS